MSLTGEGLERRLLSDTSLISPVRVRADPIHFAQRRDEESSPRDYARPMEKSAYKDRLTKLMPPNLGKFECRSFKLLLQFWKTRTPALAAAAFKSEVHILRRGGNRVSTSQHHRVLTQLVGDPANGTLILNPFNASLLNFKMRSVRNPSGWRRSLLPPAPTHLHSITKHSHIENLTV